MSDEKLVLSILEDVFATVTVESNEKFEKSGDEVPKRSKRSTFSQTSSEGLCRICYDNLRYPIIYPCRCKGTMGAVHQPCLERWLEESNRSSCEVCGVSFDVERTPKHSPLESIIIFIKKSPQELQTPNRPLKIDLIRCLILTTLTLIGIYLFIIAGDFYSSNNFSNFPPAKWTHYSLIFLIFLIIISYFIWTFLTLDYQKCIWYWWWQKTSTVRMNYHNHLVNERKNLNLNYYNRVISRV